MKKFIIKILVLTFTLYGFLYISHLSLVNRLNSHNYLPEPGFDYTLTEKNFDLLWLGNSRTLVHVNQREINDYSQLTSYSLIVDGGDPSILFYKIKNFLNNNYVPSKINIQCDYTMAKSTFETKKVEVSQYLNWKMKKSLLDTYSWVDPLYFYVPLISFDFATIVKIILRYRPERYLYGYLAIDKHFGYKTNLTWNHKFDSNTYDLTKSEYLDSIIKICVSKSIPEITLWTAPSSLSLERANQYFPSLDSTSRYFSHKYDAEINYINLRDTTKFNDSALFYNHTHLNTKGVDVLTDDIKRHSKFFCKKPL